MNELDIIRNHFLGFHNDFFDSFRTVSTYPPYNIREKDDKGVIEFAVAGFTEEDLKINVVENTLTVAGEKKERMLKTFGIKEFLIADSKRLFSCINTLLLMVQSSKMVCYVLHFIEMFQNLKKHAKLRSKRARSI